MDTTKMPETTHEHVVEQLIGKDWGELEVLEHASYLLFPDKLYKRNVSGGFDEKRVMLRVPRPHELRKARTMARSIAAEDGLDPKLDRDLIEDIETICILSMAIRDGDSSVFEPWMEDPRKLEKSYDKASLMQIYAKLDSLMKVVDPAPDDISEVEMFALMGAITKERNLSPLLVYGSGAQTTFVVTMAERYMNLLVSKSSSEPSEPSTQESSVSSDSPPS